MNDVTSVTYVTSKIYKVKPQHENKDSPRPNHRTMKTSPELCGIEFRSAKRLREFLRLNPLLAHTTILSAGRFRILVLRCADFPTRESQEIFSRTGEHVATFIGPATLEYIYQIKLAAPGEVGGYRPEAFK